MNTQDRELREAVDLVRFAAMLSRRNYHPILHIDPDEGEVEIYVQPTDSRLHGEDMSDPEGERD